MMPPSEIRAWALSLEPFSGGGLTLLPISTAGLNQLFTTSSELEVGIFCLESVVKNPMFLDEIIPTLTPDQLNMVAEWGGIMLKCLAAFQPLEGFKAIPTSKIRWTESAFEYLAADVRYKSDYDYQIWQKLH